MAKYSSYSNSSALPLVTVAMPVYNAGRYLRTAVMSIVIQTFEDWELLIVDDGSTDGSLSSITDIQDSRIRILRDGSNKGLAERLNECIDLARGKYIARMDQDDVAYPERFAKQVEALEQDEHLDLLSVRAVKVTAADEPIGLYPYLGSHESICARPWVGFHFPHPTWMGRAAWFREFRYANPGPYYSEDMDLLLRSHESSRFAMLPDVLLAYRVRQDILWNKQFKARAAVLRVQWHIFRARRQWAYATLSVLVMFARLAFDAVQFARQKLHLPELRGKLLLESERRDWESVKDQLLRQEVGK